MVQTVAADVQVQQIARQFHHHRPEPSVLQCAERAAHRRRHLLRHQNLLGQLGDRRIGAAGVEHREHLRLIARMAQRQEQHRHRIGKRRGDAGECVLRAGPILHREHAGRPAVGNPGIAVRHVHADALLPADDRAQTARHRGLDHRRGGKAEQRGDAFALQNLHDGIGCAHRSLPCGSCPKPRRGPPDPSTVRQLDAITGSNVMPASISRRGILRAGAAIGAAAALPRRARAADKPIRIGVLTDMAGPYAANTGPGSVLGAQMAVEDFMRAQSLDKGRDRAGRPATEARRRAGDRRATGIDNEGVDVITDVPLSSAAFAIGDLVKQKDKVAIFTGGASADITGRQMRAEPFALGLRHLVDAARRGGCGGEGRRRHLVLHHRRLCVRALAGEGRGKFRHRRRRQGTRPGAGAVPRHDRFLRRSWCRRRPAAPR